MKCSPFARAAAGAVLFAVLWSAAPAGAGLTGGQEKRVAQARMLLEEVDARSAREIIDEFNRTPAPLANLQIYEAVAATYAELVKRKEMTDAAAKKQLYNQIRLNVAYLQFGGDPEGENSRKLDLWIRQTLFRHLPRGLMDDPAVFHTLE
ncbi:MAG: hypothetical protein A3C36_03105 [Omnitrophica WOR_2 bacterium RIFCSPHIGHO2_02_FULL_52_10]|nr:MAG: hypothetical protein A3C36_03105 [Omnitrophica WOR_2 bacterium RIFCSPHIGHO2_02_FULL_52_10]